MERSVASNGLGRECRLAHLSAGCSEAAVQEAGDGQTHWALAKELREARRRPPSSDIRNSVPFDGPLGGGGRLRQRDSKP